MYGGTNVFFVSHARLNSIEIVDHLVNCKKSREKYPF